MEYYKPVGESDPNASYSNGNAGAGIKGSIPDARAIEHPMREILSVITAAGLTPDEGDLEQLLDAINALITNGTPDASTTVKGKVELATVAETQTGTDAVRAVTPAALSSRTATDSRAGIVELATDAEVQTGTDTARGVTPAGLLAAFVRSITSPGRIKLPGGLIIQWGIASWAGGTSSVAVTFPIAFPNGTFGVFANYLGIAHTSNLNSACAVLASPTLSGCTIGSNINNAGSGAQAAFWLALGN